MFYPNLDTLQAVSVTTAGLPPDGYGSGTSVMLVPRMPASTWQRTIEFDGVAAGVPIGESPPGSSVDCTPPVGGRRLVRRQRTAVRPARAPPGRRDRTLDPLGAGSAELPDSRTTDAVGAPRLQGDGA